MTMDLRPLKTSIKSILTSPAAHRRVGKAIANRVNYIAANNFVRRIMKSVTLPNGVLPYPCDYADGLYLFEGPSGAYRCSHLEFLQESESLGHAELISTEFPGRIPKESLLISRPFVNSSDWVDTLKEEMGAKPFKQAADLEAEAVEALSVQEERILYQNLQVHSDKFLLSVAYEPTPKELINAALHRFASRFGGKLPENTELLVSSDMMMRIRGVVRDLSISKTKWHSGYIGRWSYADDVSVPVFSDAGRPKSMRFMEDEDILIYAGEDSGQVTDRGINPVDPISTNTDYIPGRGWIISRTISMAVDLNKVLLARVA